MSNDDIFGGAKKNLGIASFKPREASRDTNPEAEARAEETASKHGFVSREPIEPLKRVERVRKKTIVQDTVYIRGPLEMTNQFKDFCNREGLNYGEALEWLMKKAKVWSS